MKALLRTIPFYLAAAVCLWPLYVNVTQVVTYVQMAARAGRLLRVLPGPVLVSILEAVLVAWAIGAAVVLFRKRQDSFAWLILLLALLPILSRLILRVA